MNRMTTMARRRGTTARSSREQPKSRRTSGGATYVAGTQPAAPYTSLAHGRRRHVQQPWGNRPARLAEPATGRAPSCRSGSVSAARRVFPSVRHEDCLPSCATLSDCVGCSESLPTGVDCGRLGAACGWWPLTVASSQSVTVTPGEVPIARVRESVVWVLLRRVSFVCDLVGSRLLQKASSHLARDRYVHAADARAHPVHLRRRRLSPARRQGWW